MQVKFTRLNYFPSFISNDCMEIGILFHEIENDIRRFEVTTNWSRLKSFDDELDIEYMKLILDGIKNEVSNDNLFSYNQKFDIKKYAKFYVNELKFTDVRVAQTDNLESFIEETKKMFLRYDYDKSERPNRNQQISYMRKLFKENNIKYSSHKIDGGFNEDIQYDYIVDNYAFKLFSFEDKKINKLVSSAKTWAFNAEEMKDIYKTVFIYDTESNDRLFESIVRILSKDAYKVMNMNEALDFIFELQKECNNML